MKIGIDVGGTNTDIVLIDDQNQIAYMKKIQTSFSVEESILLGIQLLLQELKILPEQISEVSIGTTHALNALLSGEGLLPTGLIRIASNRPRLSLAAGIPKRLQEAFIVGGALISGGFECDGRTLAPFSEDELLLAVDQLLMKNAKGIALVSTFGSLYPEHEIRAEEIIKKYYGSSLFLTKSHIFGGIGFVDRENAALINTALFSPITVGFTKLEEALSKLKIAPRSIFLV